MMADNVNNLQDSPAGEQVDEPMTEAQRVYLESLANQTGEPSPDEHLSKSAASEQIERLRREAGITQNDEDDIELGEDDRSDAV